MNDIQENVNVEEDEEPDCEADPNYHNGIELYVNIVRELEEIVDA